MLYHILPRSGVAQHPLGTPGASVRDLIGGGGGGRYHGLWHFRDIGPLHSESDLLASGNIITNDCSGTYTTVDDINPALL